ncbi:MAG: amino acid--tRNA ligase-related protein [Candidatus Dojkabacteria bacterium]
MKTWQLLKQDPDLFERYFVKEYIIKAIRIFFELKKYHELESPILTPVLPQERYMDPLRVDLELTMPEAGKKGQRIKEEVYITPTTERYNKVMLAAGLGEHFVITKVARAMEDISPNHGAEFTMLEWYHLNADYKDIMNDTEDLIIFIIDYLKKHSKLPQYKNEDYKITFQGQEIDFAKGWERLSIPEALIKYADVKLEDIQTLGQIKDFVKRRGHLVNGIEDWQALFELIFLTYIEPNIVKAKPTFIYDFPRILGPLTKPNKDNPLVCEKVELYIAGKEIANGYTELTDGNLLEQNFKIEQQAREKLGKAPVAFDQDLVDAVRSGMPEVGGIGMGLDRLAMIFADAKNISEVNFFPATDWF